MAAEQQRGWRLPFPAGATDLFCIAKHAADRVSAEAPGAPHELRESSLISIVFSALSVEGVFNELESLDYWTSEERPSLVDSDEKLKAIQRVLALAEEAGLQGPTKLILFHEIVGQRLDRGASLFQDYFLLKQLRDAIAHPKRTSITFTGEPRTLRSSRARILRALASRGLLSADPESRGQPFLAWLSSERVAPWAVEVASRVVCAILAALPSGEFKDATELFFREFSLQP